MKHLPPEFIDRMKGQLGDEADAFFNALQQPSPVSIRLHHRKGRTSFELHERVPWCRQGYYLGDRPAFHMDPHWHGGAYYVQEASSMILDDVIRHLCPDPVSRTWVDLCAAPGGKTGILASHMGRGDVLIANEVVSQRRNILRENLVKAGYMNTFVTGLSSPSFDRPLADVLLIDAPCAGEGMMRKDEEAIDQWNPGLVQSCSLLQQQIVEDAAVCLKPGGYLIYSTCSYSMDENIHNVTRFIENYDLLPIPIPFPDHFAIAEIKNERATGYQLYPHHVKGEGLFIAVMQKPVSGQDRRTFSRKNTSSFQSIPAWLTPHLQHPETLWVRKESPGQELITLEAQEKANEILQWRPGAELISQAGELKGRDFVPSHFLAMSGFAHEQYPVLDLDLQAALDYLERHTTSLPAIQKPGWHLLRYDGTTLGWAKYTLQGWKNYYPMSWRLRKRGTS